MFDWHDHVPPNDATLDSVDGEGTPDSERLSPGRRCLRDGADTHPAPVPAQAPPWHRLTGARQSQLLGHQHQQDHDHHDH